MTCLALRILPYLNLLFCFHEHSLIAIRLLIKNYFQLFLTVASKPLGGVDTAFLVRANRLLRFRGRLAFALHEAFLRSLVRLPKIDIARLIKFDSSSKPCMA